MATYIVRRLIWVPILLVIVSFITFALGRFGPGDPVQILLGQNFRQDAYERIRAQQGLDDPIGRTVRTVRGKCPARATSERATSTGGGA